MSHEKPEKMDKRHDDADQRFRRAYLKPDQSGDQRPENINAESDLVKQRKNTFDKEPANPDKDETRGQSVRQET